MMEKMRNRKKKKGFTLIELIVVIAILGILALIAIPRFAGFTERGKVAAAEQYVAIVANGVTTLLAAGEITGDVPLVITASDGKVTSTNSTFSQANLEKLVAPKKLQTKNNISFTVSADGTYTKPTITP